MSLLQHPSTESPFYSNTATGTGDNKAFSVRNTRPRITQVNESCLEFLLTETVETMFSNALAELPDTKPQDDKVQMASCTTALSSSQREGVYLKLEMLGFRVGYALSERLSRDRPRFTDTLDIVKFVCKDVWTTTFAKQIDNLKTNHRGVYVLQDNNFRWFTRMSTDLGAQDAASRAIPYLWFPCGVIRGALHNLGVTSVVLAETTTLPQCTFQIKIQK